jgi:tRNA threonylcarbamoyladenosine biosynthesis protein TsaB
MILAIDTATQYAGLALYNDDGLRAEETWYTDRNHTVELMPRLARMLESAQLKVSDLTALAVSIGPGSFTGLRIGLAVAKGIALPYKLAVVGIPTLEAAAYPFRDQSLPVWAIAQAGRNRILAAGYGKKKGRWQQLIAPTVTTVEALLQQLEPPLLCTGEIDAQAAKLLGQKAQVASPAARLRRPGYVAELAAQRLAANEQDDPDALVPIYVSSI